MQISERLKLVSDFVSTGNTLADIGTDHGYIPIYLVRENRIKKAIAMDINKGPLERADNNIQEYGFNQCIETRLSDGMEKLKENEADTILIAGMGGALTVRIMEQGIKVMRSAKEIIVSPHSEIFLVRKFLIQNDFDIVKEDMIYDQGKYYTIIKALPVKNLNKDVYKEYPDYYTYGRLLIEEKNKTLIEYLVYIYEKNKDIINKISRNKNAIRRKIELENENNSIEELIKSLKEG